MSAGAPVSFHVDGTADIRAVLALSLRANSRLRPAGGGVVLLYPALGVAPKSIAGEIGVLGIHALTGFLGTLGVGL